MSDDGFGLTIVLALLAALVLGGFRSCRSDEARLNQESYNYRYCLDRGNVPIDCKATK